MNTLFAIIVHVMLNIWIGWTFLRLGSKDRNGGEVLTTSFLIGFYLETLFIASMGFLGIPTLTALITILIITSMIFGLSVFLKGISVPRLTTERLKWYDWLLILSVGEKIVFGWMKLTRTPLYFDDTFTHWAGRGRAIFGQFNWSFNPESEVFLGLTGNKGYPLGIPIWRAVTAHFNGEWNDIIARADGMIFFISMVAIIWLAVWRFSGSRWLATGSAFILSALPLQIWHGVAGYGDIAVETFLIAGTAALLREDLILGGIFAAGAAWMKNDGLLYLPAFLIMALLIPLPSKQTVGFGWFRRGKWGGLPIVLLGMMTLSPWWIFKSVYAPDVVAAGQGFSWHADAPVLFWLAVIKGATHNILWIFLPFSILINIRRLTDDAVGRGLAGMLFAAILAIGFVFSCTEAYEFLRNQMTIHRSMLQVYGISILVMAYGVWLKISPVKKTS